MGWLLRLGCGDAPDSVGQGRVELPTSRLSGVRSNHLSYWPCVAASSVPRSGLLPEAASAGETPTESLAPWKLNRTLYLTKSPLMLSSEPSGL